MSPSVAAPRSGGRQAHLPQRHLRQNRMSVGEAVANLEMVEVVEHGEFMAITALGERGDEGPRLALEFRALARAVGDADRAAYPGEVAQGAERRLFPGRERDVVAARAQHDRAHLVETAGAYTALDHVVGQAERLPVRRQQHGGKMPAGRMARDINPRWIAAEGGGVAVQPGDGATD